MNRGGTAVWPLTWPQERPSVPQNMSFSLLREIEECPRRWQLSRASYPMLWSGPGYPAAVNQLQIDGWAIHGAMETIVNALAQKGCRSSREPEAIAVIREVGGLTRLLAQSYERVIAETGANPRAAPLLTQLRRSIGDRIEGARVTLQAMLSRLEIVGRQKAEKAIANGESDGGIRRNGTYSEVSVHVPSLGWTGAIDLLTVTNHGCEIRDFKTGARKDHHPLQVRIYALLWRRDERRNPLALRATTLVLSYGDGDITLAAPDEGELATLEAEITKRANAAKAECVADVPIARPAPDVCRYCSVRQLCSEYWAQHVPQLDEGQPLLTDVELVVSDRYALRSWEAVLRNPAGSLERVSLRMRDDRAEFAQNQRLRLLNVFVSKDADEGQERVGPLVVSLSATSEIYTLAAES